MYRTSMLSDFLLPTVCFSLADGPREPPGVRVVSAEKLSHVYPHVSMPHPTPTSTSVLSPSCSLSFHTEAPPSHLPSSPLSYGGRTHLSSLKSTTFSPEFDGGPAEDDADELLHHLDHLFLAGDLGEGHPQASSSSSPRKQG